MDITTLLIIPIIGAVVVGLVFGVFFALIILTLLIYIVSHVYPWLQKICLWCARPENFLSFLIVAVLLFILIIFDAVFLRQPIVLLLLVVPLVLFIPLQLGILVYTLRLISWLYNLWQSLVMRLYLSARVAIMGAKLKHDHDKATDWKIKLSEMKAKLSEEAELARSRITRRRQ